MLAELPVFITIYVRSASDCIFYDVHKQDTLASIHSGILLSAKPQHNYGALPDLERASCGAP